MEKGPFGPFSFLPDFNSGDSVLVFESVSKCHCRCEFGMVRRVCRYDDAALSKVELVVDVSEVDAVLRRLDIAGLRIVLVFSHD